LPDATAKDSALAPGPEAANVPGDGVGPMIHIPDAASNFTPAESVL